MMRSFFIKVFNVLKDMFLYVSIASLIWIAYGSQFIQFTFSENWMSVAYMGAIVFLQMVWLWVHIARSKSIEDAQRYSKYLERAALSQDKKYNKLLDKYNQLCSTQEEVPVPVPYICKANICRINNDGVILSKQMHFIECYLIYESHDEHRKLVPSKGWISRILWSNGGETTFIPSQNDSCAEVENAISFSCPNRCKSADGQYYEISNIVRSSHVKYKESLFQKMQKDLEELTEFNTKKFPYYATLFRDYAERQLMKHADRIMPRSPNEEIDIKKMREKIHSETSKSLLKLKKLEYLIDIHYYLYPCLKKYKELTTEEILQLKKKKDF